MSITEKARQLLGGLWSSQYSSYEYGVDSVVDVNQSIYKAVIPKFLYKPPYGYPLFKDIPEIRRLAKTPYIEMAISTIIDEVSAVDWEIVPADENSTANEENINAVREFFKSPNQNFESFEQFLRKWIRDILEIDAGVINKVFNQAGYFREMLMRDGGTFTKNPNQFGMMTDRAELVPTWKIENMSDEEAHEYFEKRPAYFQYGWITGAKPQPFGRREIIYTMRNPRADDIYGRSPVEVLLDIIQMLTYGVDANLEYFTNNYIPKGVWEVLNANKEQIMAFKQRLKDTMKSKNEVGDWRRKFYETPVIGTEVNFKPVQYSNQDLQLLEQQEWFLKIVWACFGITPSELGFTQDSNRATELHQGKVFRRKAIRPILQIIEYAINNQVIPEFEKGYMDKDGKIWEGITDVKFQFKMEDTTEEIEKNELYQLQIRNGIKTKNEVREELGLEPLEGGDKLRDDKPQFNFSNQEKEERSAFEEEKSLTTDSSTIPKEFEEMSEPEKVIWRSIKEAMKEDEKMIVKILERQLQKSGLENIKAIDRNIIDKLKNMLDLSSTKDEIVRAIQKAFGKGLEKAEEQLDMNFTPDQRAIDFLQGHTFDNVKDMSEEMKNDLRSELERALMNDETKSDIVSRVKKIFDNSENRAKAIAQTEINRATNQGHLAGYKQAGVKGKKKYVAVLDDKTSAICRRLDGQEVGIDEKFHDKQTGWKGQVPPAHVNCRSRVVYEVEE